MRLLLLLTWSVLLTGCTSLDSFVEPKADLSSNQRFWVERSLSDNHAMGIKITRALQSRGRQAEHGPLTMLPSEKGWVVLSFRDHWAWDFHDHLAGLQVMVRDARTKQLLGRAQFEGPLAMHLDEFEIIDRVLDELLGQVESQSAPAGS